jgi:ABC-2 type transport system ATP-binding protein
MSGPRRTENCVTTDTAAIAVRGLEKSFGERRAVRGVSFRVERGQIVGLLGVNGAGKTTTMRLLSGVLAPDAGCAEVMGVDAARAPEQARRSIGYLPEQSGGFRHLTAAELIAFVAETRGLTGAAATTEIRRVATLVGLGPAMGQTLGTLSKGWRQRAWLAQALVGDPPVLILDEPTDGLDPNQKIALRALLGRLKGDRAILMSTHILEEAEALCDRVVVIAEGAVVADAVTATLLDDKGRIQPAFVRLTGGVAA